MKASLAGVSLIIAVALTGCVSLEVGTETSPSRLEIKGLANGYASLNGLRAYDGKILRFGLLSKSEREAEVVSFDLWPLAGAGIGVVGARLRVLPLDMGVGALWYESDPRQDQPGEILPTPADETPAKKEP